MQAGASAVSNNALVFVCLGVDAWHLVGGYELVGPRYVYRVQDTGCAQGGDT